MIESRLAGTVVLLIVLSSAALAGARTAVGGTAVAGRGYDSAEAAVTALVEALRTDQLGKLWSVLGPGSERLLSSGDWHSDAAERKRFIAAYDEKHELVSTAPDRLTLQVGNDDWPLPIPLVQANGRWHFDSRSGAQELVKRRIARNELAAIRTARAYVDAQKVFSSTHGQGAYAQRLVSSHGKYNGLYWPAAPGAPDSPLEPLMLQAKEKGYPGARVSGKPMPYQGYYFRILIAQGAKTSEGARNYVSNGRMTGGFGLIGWPASYGASGIMTFIVNQDENVFQKDLGPRTETIAPEIKVFDPDLSWVKVDVVD